MRVLHLYFQTEFLFSSSFKTKYYQTKIQWKYSTCLLYVNRFTEKESVVITLNKKIRKLILSRNK